MLSVGTIANAALNWKSSWKTKHLITETKNLVTSPVISDELGKDREVFTTSGTYPWSLRLHVSFNLSAPNIQLLTFL
jgi:hypothetical protein